MKKIIKLCLFTIISATSLSALANLPYYPIEFPRDDAAHYDNTPYPVTNLSEWWYYNGTLTSKTGRKLGFFFTFGNIQSEKNGKKTMMPTFQIQIADVDNHKVYATEQAFLNKNEYSISTQALDIVLGKNLRLKKVNNVYQADGSIQLAKGPRVNFSLEFTPMRDPLLLNKTGLVDYGDGTNTYYYSQTKLQTSGFVQLDKETFELDPKQSISWMDHQWGDFFLSAKSAWMWACVQLKNGLDIALAVEPGSTFGFADIIMPDNSRIYINDLQKYSYVAHPVVPGQKHPTTYDLSIPDIGLQVRIDALVPGQDVLGFWEGVSKVKGTFQGVSVEGQSNTENTMKY